MVSTAGWMGRKKKALFADLPFLTGDTARDVRASLGGGRVRGEAKTMKSKIQNKKQELLHKKQELAQIGHKLRAAKEGAERSEQIKRGKKTNQQIFQLRRELQELRRLHAAIKEAEVAANGQTALRLAGESETGAVPDFVVIGAAKGGTTFLYHLLTRHPLVEHAAVKEPHYFDLLFEEGTEWYRRCFPTPT